MKTNSQPAVLNLDKLDKIRFGLGTEHYRRSAIYVCWYSKQGDYYLGAMGLSGKLKVSLHQSGDCHFKFDYPYWKQLTEAGLTTQFDRFLVRWRRPKTPSGGAVRALQLRLPTDYLRGELAYPTFRKPPFIFTPAPPGAAYVFDFYYSQESPAAMESKFIEAGFKPLFYTPLATGEFVSITRRIVKFPYEPTFIRRYPLTAAIPLSPKGMLAPGEAMSGLSLVVHNKPSDDEALILTEANGITITHDTSKRRRNKFNLLLSQR